MKRKEKEKERERKYTKSFNLTYRAGGCLSNSISADLCIKDFWTFADDVIREFFQTRLIVQQWDSNLLKNVRKHREQVF